MLTLTESAAGRIRTLLTGRDDLEDPGLRIRVVAGGCSGMSYRLDLTDATDPDDKVYVIHGVKVFVDATSDAYLEGVVVDWKESMMGASFTFKNPNAQGSCGCGESFHT